MKIRLMTILPGVMALVLTLPGYPLAAEQPKGELKIAVVGLGHDIPVPSMENAKQKDYMKLLYDPLVGADAKAQMSTGLGVAEKWEMTPDGLTWTFYLRKGVKFHDGAEVTAKDVKFSMEQVMRPDSKAQDAGTARDTIKGMEVKDPYTFVVHCKQPSIFLPSLFSDIQGNDGLIQPKDYTEKVGDAGFLSRPIGSGPYKFHSRAVGSFIKLEATDRHWRDGVPKFKYVTFLVVPEESSRIAMLKTGQANITDISRDKVGELEKAGLKVASKSDAAFVQATCGMQWLPGPFSDIRFRKALTLAINRDEVIKHIFAGRAKPSSTFPGRVVLGLGGDSNLKPYPYDPAEAKRLLKEGGYEGHQFTVVSYPREGCPEFPRVVEAAVGYWEAIGLKPKIAMTEYSAYRLKRRAGKTENEVFGGEMAIAPEYPSLIRYIRLQTHSTAEMTCIKSPELDKMIDRAGASMDTAEVNKILGDIHRYFYDNYVFVPFADINYEVAATKDVPDWDLGLRRADRNFNALISQK